MVVFLKHLRALTFELQLNFMYHILSLIFVNNLIMQKSFKAYTLISAVVLGVWGAFPNWLLSFPGHISCYWARGDLYSLGFNVFFSSFFFSMFFETNIEWEGGGREDKGSTGPRGWWETTPEKTGVSKGHTFKEAPATPHFEGTEPQGRFVLYHGLTPTRAGAKTVYGTNYSFFLQS